jgi:hypothetical protein
MDWPTTVKMNGNVKKSVTPSQRMTNRMTAEVLEMDKQVFIKFLMSISR